MLAIKINIQKIMKLSFIMYFHSTLAVMKHFAYKLSLPRPHNSEIICIRPPCLGEGGGGVGGKGGGGGRGEK
jgi:uncharacterized membrane protein